MLPIAELSNGQVRGRGCEFSRRAMLISPANEEDLVAKLPAKARMNIRGKERTDKVAEVLDAVHIRNGTRDQKFWHRVRPLSLQGRRTRTANKKALPLRTEGLRDRLSPSLRGRALSPPAGPDAVGQGHSSNG